MRFRGPWVRRGARACRLPWQQPRPALWRTARSCLRTCLAAAFLDARAAGCHSAACCGFARRRRGRQLLPGEAVTHARSSEPRFPLWRPKPRLPARLLLRDQKRVFPGLLEGEGGGPGPLAAQDLAGPKIWLHFPTSSGAGDWGCHGGFSPCSSAWRTCFGHFLGLVFFLGSIFPTYERGRLKDLGYEEWGSLSSPLPNISGAFPQELQVVDPMAQIRGEEGLGPPFLWVPGQGHRFNSRRRRPQGRKGTGLLSASPQPRRRGVRVHLQQGSLAGPCTMGHGPRGTDSIQVPSADVCLRQGVQGEESGGVGGFVVRKENLEMPQTQAPRQLGCG